MRHFYFRLILGIVFILYASLLFSFDPRHRFYLLYDLQLYHHEHPVCFAVYLPRRCVSVFRLFYLEERKR